VEFSSGAEARAAFKALAYRNFRGRPLMLEKAPETVFLPAAEAQETFLQCSKETPSVDAEDVKLHSSTLYVKNLSFSTGAESFRRLFSELTGFRSAKIATKRDPSKPGSVLSMGFGFVEFDSVENAKLALKSLKVRLISVKLYRYCYARNILIEYAN
jgi:multiple RNA-binding domain-containing protein 1